MGRCRWWALELWSLLGLTSEFFKGFWKLHYLGHCVTVFGSARFPQGHRYYELARQVGQELAAAGFTTMTGGGPGIMEAANRGAKEAGGLSVGLWLTRHCEARPTGPGSRSVEAARSRPLPPVLCRTPGASATRGECW